MEGRPSRKRILERFGMHNRTRRCTFANFKTYLGNLPLVPIIGVLGVVLERLRARKFMIAGWSSADVALTGDLARETGHGTSNYDFPRYPRNGQLFFQRRTSSDLSHHQEPSIQVG